MIKVNLIVGKRKSEPEIFGVKLNVINIPAILLVMVFWWVFDSLIMQEYVSNKVQEANQKFNKINAENRKLKKKIKKEGNIEEQIKKLESDKKRFRERFSVVKTIIKQKKNPFNMMYFISNNIPSDVWLTELNVSNDEIIISGESHSYPSINKLIGSLKRATFFERDIELLSAGTVTDKDSRREKFSVKAKIRKYE